MPNQLSVRKLNPAAARLLLALCTQKSGETYDEIVVRSGIGSYLTFSTARQQLRELGFLIMHEGRECPTLFAQEPTERTTEPVVTMWPGAVSRVTNAKQ